MCDYMDYIGSIIFGIFLIINTLDFILVQYQDLYVETTNSYSIIVSAFLQNVNLLTRVVLFQTNFIRFCPVDSNLVHRKGEVPCSSVNLFQPWLRQSRALCPRVRVKVRHRQKYLLLPENIFAAGNYLASWDQTGRSFTWHEAERWCRSRGRRMVSLDSSSKASRSP